MCRVLRPGIDFAYILGMEIKDFQKYVWGFYGPNQIYGDYFNHTLTFKEVKAACILRALQPNYAADSVDREAVRDILLTARGVRG